MKIGPVDPEIIWLKLKKKKLTQAKYVALPAILPSGLNNQHGPMDYGLRYMKEGWKPKGKLKTGLVPFTGFNLGNVGRGFGSSYLHMMQEAVQPKSKPLQEVCLI